MAVDGAAWREWGIGLGLLAVIFGVCSRATAAIPVTSAREMFAHVDKNVSELTMGGYICSNVS